MSHSDCIETVRLLTVKALMMSPDVLMKDDRVIRNAMFNQSTLGTERNQANVLDVDNGTAVPQARRNASLVKSGKRKRRGAGFRQS